MAQKLVQWNILLLIFGLFGFHLKAAPNQRDNSKLEREIRPSASVVFSPQTMAESHLAKSRQWLDAAQSSVDIAMYSLSRNATEIMSAIRSAQERGLRVRILLQQANDDRKKPEGSLSAQLESWGIDVRYINQIMHHKFALIDSRGSDERAQARLITGSANWSGSAATYYDENTLFIEDDRALIQSFREEFDKLWVHSRDFVWSPLLSDLQPDPLHGIDQAGLGSQAVFTSANFEVTSSRFGKGFKVIEGRNTVSDRIVEAIARAQQSIWIASGHYRSHAIAEAILQAKVVNPALDIRIYLDNQEFISLSAQNTQKAQQKKCLKEASSEAARTACYDRGYYYSYEAHAAGIPLRFKSYAYRWHYSYAPQMHHKFILIDNQMLLTGSYNFSDNAEHATMENLIFLSHENHGDIVEAYRAHFEGIWDLNRNRYETFLGLLDTLDPVPLVFTAMALTWKELSELKKRMAANCPAIQSQDYREYPEKHQVCPRIE